MQPKFEQNYDVGDSPENSNAHREENLHQFSAIAARAWEKINGWQKKAGNAAGWIESLAKVPVNRKPECCEDSKCFSESTVNKINERSLADGALKDFSVHSGSSFSDRSVSTVSIKSHSSSSASSSLSGTPNISSLPLSPSSTSSRDSGNPAAYRRSISPFPSNEGDGASQALSRDAFESPRSGDSSKEFMKVSKALRQGWRWLVCRFLMRQYGSASVDRLLKYCGFEIPQERTYTLETFAKDSLQNVCDGNDLTLTMNNPGALSNLISGSLSHSAPKQVCIAERGRSCLDAGRADMIRAQSCGEILRTARSQRNEVKEIVKEAQFMATAAGMWPPLAWVGNPVLHMAPGSTVPNQPAPPQSSPTAHVAPGPTDLGCSNPSSSRFSWDQFADMLGPMMTKSDHAESTGFAWWQGSYAGKRRDCSTCSGEGCRARDSPGGDHSIYVVSNLEGHSYEGEFKEGKMHGYGRLKWPDGHWYQGQFDKERTCGIGIRGWPSGHWYVGEEQGGWKEGLGAMGWPGGRRYEGEFRKDLRNGFGLMTWPGGRWYLGNWKDGLQQGEGLEGVAGIIYLIQSNEGNKQTQIQMDSPSLEQALQELISQDCVKDISALASEHYLAVVDNGTIPKSVAASSNDCVPPDDVSKASIGRGRRRGSSSYTQSVTSEPSIKEDATQPGSHSGLKIEICNLSNTSSVMVLPTDHHKDHDVGIDAECEVEKQMARSQEEDINVAGTTSTDNIKVNIDDTMLGDEGFASDEDYEFEEGSSSSESVDVSSGYDDSSSDDNAARAGDIKEAHQAKEGAARLRNSERLVEMIQGGAIWSMLDEDDGDEVEDSSQGPNGRRGLDHSRRDVDAAGNAKRGEAAVPCRMLAEHLAAESERSLVRIGCGKQLSAVSRTPARPIQSSRSSGSLAGRAAGVAIQSQPADPQLPCHTAAALSALWRSAGAGDSAGVARALRRISAEIRQHRDAVDVGDPADGGASALIKAARTGSVECVMHLLKAGAEVGRRDLEGGTAMHAAASHGHSHVIDALATAGGDVRARSICGDTPLHAAAGSGHVAACTSLVALGADPNTAGSGGSTALHRCEIRGHAGVARALIALGAGRNAKDSAGEKADGDERQESGEGVPRP